MPSHPREAHHGENTNHQITSKCLFMKRVILLKVNFGKMELNEPEGRNDHSWHLRKHAELYSDLLQTERREPMRGLDSRNGDSNFCVLRTLPRDTHTQKKHARAFTHAHACTHTHTRTYADTYPHTNTHTYKHTRTHVCAHTHTQAHTRTRGCVCKHAHVTTCILPMSQ